jgi:hypothetical protein
MGLFVSIFNIGILGSLATGGEGDKFYQERSANNAQPLGIGSTIRHRQYSGTGGGRMARDYRPFITDMDISGHGISSATSLKNIVIYNDLLFFSRPAVAGDSLDVLLDSTLPSEFKRQAIDFGLQGYFEFFYRLWMKTAKGCS